MSKYTHSYTKLNKDKSKSIIDLTKIRLNKKKIINRINPFIEILINIYLTPKIINIFQIIKNIEFDSLDINKDIFPHCKELYIKN